MYRILERNWGDETLINPILQESVMSFEVSKSAFIKLLLELYLLCQVKLAN